MNLHTHTTTLELIALGHLDGACRLSRQAGWPHRPEDWRFALAISEGCVALDGAEVVGTALMTPFGSDATLNMVIVDAAQRGRGVGRALMNAAMDLAGARHLRLIATDEGLPLYEKLGFRAVGEIVQYQGLAAPFTPTAAAGDGVPGPAGGVQDREAIAALDRVAYGADRATLIDELARHGHLVGLRRAGRIDGYACRRDFGRGEVIGPVIARDEADARALIASLLAGRAGQFVRVDVPVESGLGPWLAAQGLAPVGGGIAMRRPFARAVPGSLAPDIRMDAPLVPTCFALASQAYG